MKRSSVFIAVCVILFSAKMNLQAQEVQYNEAESRYAFSVEPLYLYNGSLRLNVEKRLETGDWVELNITGYDLPHDDSDPSEYGYITSNSDFGQIAGLSGLGFGGVYKHYFSRFLFASGSASYTYYRVRYVDFGLDFSSYMEDNLDFYEYCYQDIRQIFNKFTVCFAVGARSAFRHAVFVEYSLGLGYAYSIYDKNKEAYDRTVFGFGYNGIYPAVNIKVGFNIK